MRIKENQFISFVNLCQDCVCAYMRACVKFYKQNINFCEIFSIKTNER